MRNGCLFKPEPPQDVARRETEPPKPTCLPDCRHTPRDWGHSQSGAPPDVASEPDEWEKDVEENGGHFHASPCYDPDCEQLKMVGPAASLALRSENAALKADLARVIEERNNISAELWNRYYSELTPQEQEAELWKDSER